MNRYKVLVENERKILTSVNRLMREVNGKKIPMKEAPDVSKEMNPNEKIIIDSWKSLSNKTKVFETIPLIFAVTDKEDLTANDIINILNKNYDWDPAGKDWILILLDKIKGDKKAFQTFKDVVIAGTVNPNAPTLKELYGGNKVDGFIHANITKFYAKLKSVSKHNQQSKTFTADVVLFWGPGSVQDAFRGDLLTGMKPAGESLIKLKDDSTVMACVSLKALDGRVGKVTTLFQSKFGKNVLPTPTNEGVADMLKNTISKMKDVGSNFVKKVTDRMTQFTDWSKKIKSHIVDIFSPTSKEVVDAQVEAKKISEDAEDILKEFDKEIVEHMNRSGKPITEATEDEPIQITSCFRDQLLRWYAKFDNDTKKYNKVFDDFQNTVKEYSTKNFFRIKFQSLPEKNLEFDEELKRIEGIIDSVKQAKEDSITKTGKRSIKCSELFNGTTPVTFTRKEIKNILMSNANHIAISMLNNMVNNYLKTVKTSDTKAAVSSLVKFATEINAEAIFGGAVDVPLIKYDGIKIIKYDSRDNYEVKHANKMVEYFSSIKTLPIIAIKIRPVRSKTTDVSTYYSISMFSLSDYKGSTSSTPMDKDFIYNYMSLYCISGTSFNFAVETNSTISGESVSKILAES
jgi:hypothetical protein